MSWRFSACVASIAFVVAVGGSPAAALDAAGVALPFGAQYTAPDGSTCTHRGMDVAAEPGSVVRAPRAGTVRFAGRVPGPHGGTIEAVTLETAEGRVSILPLDRLEVGKGDRVECGQDLGRASESGDPSSAAPHVHVSLRHGELYVDPAIMLAAAPHAVQPQPAPASVPVPAAKARVDAARRQPSPLQPAPLPAGVSLATAQAPAIAAGPSALVRPTTAATAVMGEGVSLAPRSGVSVAAQAEEAAVPAPYAATAEMGAVDRVRGVSAEIALGALEWLQGADAPSLAALSVAVVACSVLLGRRAFERRLVSNTPVSDRLGRLLQQLRAG